MAFFEKFRLGSRRKLPEPTPAVIRAAPGTLAQTVLLLAARHAESLVHTLQEDDVTLPEDKILLVQKELFLAYYGLVSLHVGRHLRDDASHNRFGAAMLDALREYPEGRPESVLVRQTFTDFDAVDRAMAYYVRFQLTESDRNAVEAHRKLLNLDEQNVLHYFMGLVHLSAMGIVSLKKTSRAFLAAWYNNCDSILAAVRVLDDVVPVWEE